MAEENIVTPTSDITQQEGKNPALEGQHPTAENTTAEIITENPITQTPSTTNNSEMWSKRKITAKKRPNFISAHNE